MEVTIDDGIKFPDVTPEQSVEMEAANDMCKALYPIDPKYKQPLTKAQLAYLYDWYLTEAIPCLEGEGYAGFDPPSLDTFTEEIESETGFWRPTDDVDSQIMGRGPNELARLYSVCPPGPPVDELYSS